jgi:hypothetical protein
MGGTTGPNCRAIRQVPSASPWPSVSQWIVLARTCNPMNAASAEPGKEMCHRKGDEREPDRNCQEIEKEGHGLSLVRSLAIYRSILLLHRSSSWGGDQDEGFNFDRVASTRIDLNHNPQFNSILHRFRRIAICSRLFWKQMGSTILQFS